MTAMMTLDLVLAIRDEWARAEAKYAGATVDAAVWADSERLAVLTEEVGEVAREVTLAMSPGHFYPRPTENLRAELIQVAAVALAWVNRIDRDASGGAA